MKALVTGGTGFIGGHLVDLLVENGHSVRLFSRKLELPERLDGQPVQVMKGDLKDPDSVLDAMEGIDVFFHIGEIRNTTRSASAKNVRVVERIVEHLSKAKVRRFVFISSITVAGIPSQIPADEETAPAVVLRDQYTEYKRACERTIADGPPGVEYVILRPGFVYGPRSRSLGRMIELVKRIGPIGFPFLGNGKSLAPFVEARDLAACIYHAGTRPEAAGKTFNVTDGREETWSDFFEAITSAFHGKLRLFPLPAFLVRFPALFADSFSGLFGITADLGSYVSYFSRDVHFKNDRAVSLLGWKPACADLASCVREMIASYARPGDQ
jgi:nucleoside-diphosphate-sugar epimerase